MRRSGYHDKPIVGISTDGGEEVAQHYPLPVSGDRVYATDVKLSVSDYGTFPASSDLLGLFNNLDDEIADTSSTNPKWLRISLEAPVRLSAVNIFSKTGNFSNVKISFLDRAGNVLGTPIDESASSTQYESRRYHTTTPTTATENVCCILIEFYTANPVTLSFIYVRKINNVNAYVTGIRDDGDTGHVALDNESRLQVNAQPYLYAVSEGAIGGHYSVLRKGARTSVLANTQSLIWQGTNALYTYLTSAEQIKVVSTSAEDASAGTGIRTFTITGLDANWAEISDTVTLNGITAVTTTKSFIRIFTGIGATCGTADTNVGTISITNNAGTTQLAQIFPGDNSTLIVAWTVPAGKVAYIIHGSASTDSNKGLRVSMFTRLNDGGTRYPWTVQYRAYVFSGKEDFEFPVPLVVPAKTDIEIRVLTPASAGTTSCGAAFQLWYEDV